MGCHAAFSDDQPAAALGRDWRDTGRTEESKEKTCSVAPAGAVAAITSSQILDAVLEMELVPFSETGCEITSKAGWWTATRAAGAGTCQFTMPLQLPKGTGHHLLTCVNGVWKTGPGWRITVGGLGSLDPNAWSDCRWNVASRGAFEGMGQDSLA